MDQRIKELNDKIAGLRHAYDQVEATADELFEMAKDDCGGSEAYLEPLQSLMHNSDTPMEVRFFAAFAQFGVLRLLLNEAEREHADLLLGINPGKPSGP